MSDTDTRLVAVPYQMAEELLAEGVAERASINRSETLNQVLGIIVDGIDTGASLIAIGAAGLAAKRLASSLIPRLKKQDAPSVRITLTANGCTRNHVVDLADPEAETRLLEAILEMLDENQPANDG